MSSNLQMARSLAQWAGFDHLLPNPGYQAQLPDPAFAKLYSCPLTNNNCVNRTIKAISNYSDGNITVESMVIDQFEQAVPKFKHICSEFVSEQLSGFLSTEEAKEKLISIPEDCLSAGCADIDEATVHPRSLSAAEVINQRLNSNYLSPEWKNLQEFLRFRSDDLREKMLFLSAEPNISPDTREGRAFQPWLVSGILTTLAAKYDIKYAVIQNYDELCQQVRNAAQIGELSHLVINGHGWKDGIHLSDSSNEIRQNYLLARNFDECFNGIKPEGKITLFSCATGAVDSLGYGLNNIAQKIANTAKRTVIAPTHKVAPFFSSLLNEDTEVFYHPHNRLFHLLPFYNTNLFRPFIPHFKNCTEMLEPHQIHQRELSAAEVIQKELLDKSLIPNDPHVCSDQYLKLCHDDPKDKFLVLSSFFKKEDWFGNHALNPTFSSSFLGTLVENFDLKYRVVRKISDICDQVNEASRVGNLAGVLIKGYGNEEKTGMVLSTGEEINDQTLSDLSCLSKVKKDGTIIFLGSSLGQIPELGGSESLAQKVARITNRTVIAPVCRISPKSVKILSTDPMIIDHPTYSSFNKWRLGCSETSETLMKEFNA